MNKSGYFLVNKPFGWTSFDIVQYLKRALHLKKVGHAGTLDPIAEGLMIILSEQCTGQFELFSSGIKEYRTRILLGAASDTDDISGHVTIAEKGCMDGADELKKKIFRYAETQRGEIQQKVPVYSAVKFKGKPLYHYAREGIDVKCKTRGVSIHDISLNSFDPPFVDMTLLTGRGFYVRSFCRDLGEFCGTGALMLRLTRTRIGDFSLDEAKDVKDITLDDLRE